jgi:hypothetical protein
MPRGDGTGPMGMGPMTGRAAGYCAGFPVPGFMNPMPGYGVWGGGRGRGWRRWYRATGMPGWMRASYGLPAWGMGFVPPYAGYAPPSMTAEQELEMLNQQAKALSEQLEEIKQRIGELSKEKG